MKRILVAYDGGLPARRALDTAIDLAVKFDAHLTVVSVVPIRPGRAPMDPWDDTTVHQHELQDARAILTRRLADAELLEPFGDPAQTIERLARDGDYDLVVVGSRGLGPVSRFFQGSFSEHIATHAETPVLIAR